MSTTETKKETTSAPKLRAFRVVLEPYPSHLIEAVSADAAKEAYKQRLGICRPELVPVATRLE